MCASIFGPRNAVRAQWAKSMRGTGERPNKRRQTQDRMGLPTQLMAGISTQTHYANFNVDECITIQAPAHTDEQRDNHHLMLVHKQATTRADVWDDKIYVIGDSQREHWWRRWNKSCECPARESWASRMWDAGLEAKAIRTLQGFGDGGWVISTCAETWQPIVKDICMADNAPPVTEPFVETLAIAVGA